MRLLTRTIVIGVLAIILMMVMFSGQKAVVTQQQTYQQEAEEVYRESALDNCQRLLDAPFCKSPLNSMDQWRCSDMLSSMSCREFFDVEDLIVDEHKSREINKRPLWMRNKAGG